MHVPEGGGDASRGNEQTMTRSSQIVNAMTDIGGEECEDESSVHFLHASLLDPTSMTARRQQSIAQLRAVALASLVRALHAATPADKECVNACLASVSTRLYTVKFGDR